MTDYSYLGLAINSIPVVYKLLSDYLERHKSEDKNRALDPFIEACKDFSKNPKNQRNLTEIVKENSEALKALLEILEDLQDEILQIILSLILLSLISEEP
jgi:DNA-binding transcriptional regulator GbsR (MarR family)